MKACQPTSPKLHRNQQEHLIPITVFQPVEGSHLASTIQILYIPIFGPESMNNSTKHPCPLVWGFSYCVPEVLSPHCYRMSNVSLPL